MSILYTFYQILKEEIMKKIGKLNLHNLSQAEIAKKEQNMIKGGQNCGCSCSDKPCPCKYAGVQEGPNDSFYGGSSTESNYEANNAVSMFLSLYDIKRGNGGSYYA